MSLINKIEVSEDSSQIDRSRLYLVDLVKRLSERKKRSVSYKEVEKVLLRKFKENRILARRFYVGYGLTYEDILKGMRDFGVLSCEGEGNGHGRYIISESGKLLLAEREKEFAYLFQ